ncbi:MAG: hypothetical protein CM15mP84_05400 [Cellvibrionales bacterium]|nr:MAG: hypothetical protein CM15mP84_05400 [Cellvibrionales bacterium]
MVFASVYDATGSYDLGYSIASVLFGVSVALILLLGRYPQGMRRGTDPPAKHPQPVPWRGLKPSERYRRKITTDQSAPTRAGYCHW